MKKTNLELVCPYRYDLYMTCHTHGWVYLSPFRWDDQSETLHFPAFIGETPIDIEVRQEGNQILACLISKDDLSQENIDLAKGLVSRALDLHSDTDRLLERAKNVGSEYVDIIKKGAGRLLHSPTLWEDAAKTLFTTNCTWTLTQRMCEVACSEQFSKAAPSGAFPFPPPKIFARYTPQQIKKLMPVGYRSDYLVELAKRFSEDPSLCDIEFNGFDYKEADKLVRSLKGFGNYAVAHLLILSGYFNEIPVDTVVVAYLKKNYRVRKPESFINRNYRKWKEYKWWGLKLEKMIRQQNWLGD